MAPGFIQEPFISFYNLKPGAPHAPCRYYHAPVGLWDYSRSTVLLLISPGPSPRSAFGFGFWFWFWFLFWSAMQHAAFRVLIFLRWKAHRAFEYKAQVA